MRQVEVALHDGKGVTRSPPSSAYVVLVGDAPVPSGVVDALLRGCTLLQFSRQAAEINEKQRMACNRGQKFPADPKTNWSSHSCSFQLAKTLPQTNLHW